VFVGELTALFFARDANIFRHGRHRQHMLRIQRRDGSHRSADSDEFFDAQYALDEFETAGLQIDNTVTQTRFAHPYAMMRLLRQIRISATTMLMPFPGRMYGLGRTQRDRTRCKQKFPTRQFF
jgi:hypothetical protein